MGPVVADRFETAQLVAVAPGATFVAEIRHAKRSGAEAHRDSLGRGDDGERRRCVVVRRSASQGDGGITMAST